MWVYRSTRDDFVVLSGTGKVRVLVQVCSMYVCGVERGGGVRGGGGRGRLQVDILNF